MIHKTIFRNSVVLGLGLGLVAAASLMPAEAAAQYYGPMNCPQNCFYQPCGISDGCGGTCQLPFCCANPSCAGKICGVSSMCGVCQPGSGCCSRACSGKYIGDSDGCGGTCTANDGCLPRPNCSQHCMMNLGHTDGGKLDSCRAAVGDGSPESPDGARGDLQGCGCGVAALVELPSSSQCAAACQPTQVCKRYERQLVGDIFMDLCVEYATEPASRAQCEVCNGCVEGAGGGYIVDPCTSASCKPENMIAPGFQCECRETDKGKDCTCFAPACRPATGSGGSCTTVSISPPDGCDQGFGATCSKCTKSDGSCSVNCTAHPDSCWNPLTPTCKKNCQQGLAERIRAWLDTNARYCNSAVCGDLNSNPGDDPGFDRGMGIPAPGLPPIPPFVTNPSGFESCVSEETMCSPLMQGRSYDRCLRRNANSSTGACANTCAQVGECQWGRDHASVCYGPVGCYVDPPFEGASEESGAACAFAAAGRTSSGAAGLLCLLLACACLLRRRA